MADQWRYYKTGALIASGAKEQMFKQLNLQLDMNYTTYGLVASVWSPLFYWNMMRTTAPTQVYKIDKVLFNMQQATDTWTQIS